MNDKYKVDISQLIFYRIVTVRYWLQFSKSSLKVRRTRLIYILIECISFKKGFASYK